MNIFKKNSKADDKILNEQWITHYFGITLEKPKNNTTFEFEKYLGELNIRVLENILASTIGMSEIKKSVSTKSYPFSKLPREYSRPFDYMKTTNNTYILLIRFPNITEKESKIGFKGDNSIFRYSERNKNYKFSPNQSIKMDKIFNNIEHNLHIWYGLKPVDQIMNSIHGIGDEIIVTTFDTIQYYTYPISKRIELYKSFPKIEKQVFGNDFKYAMNTILNMENSSDPMKKNKIRLNNLLKKYNVNL
jgi:hypothetical protein